MNRSRLFIILALVFCVYGVQPAWAQETSTAAAGGVYDASNPCGEVSATEDADDDDDSFEVPGGVSCEPDGSLTISENNPCAAKQGGGSDVTDRGALLKNFIFKRKSR